MKIYQFLAPVMWLFILILPACGGATHEKISTPEPDSSIPESAVIYSPTPPKTSRVESETTDGNNPVPRNLVERTRIDLSEHLGVSLEKIRMVEARAMDWPDSSLGCPQPSIVYATVITPGFWILLEADGKIYPYHTDDREQVILCLLNPSDPDVPRPIIPFDPGEIKDGEPWMPVD